MSAARNEEANVQRATEAWNAGDLNGYLELYDEGIRLHGYSPEPMDKTAERAFYEVPATGKPIALPGITILHFADGRCIERWSSADMLGLLVQLGAVPPPA